MLVWKRKLTWMVSVPVPVGINGIHLKQRRTAAIGEISRKNNAAGWRPRGTAIVHRVLRQSNILSGAQDVDINLTRRISGAPHESNLVAIR
jgi:hypothetical protein